MKNKLMTHVVAGYPTMKECEELVCLMDKSGVDYVEVQFPFSDPVADGPTIMRANVEALESGVKVGDCFELLERLRARVEVPLLIMIYYNVVFKYGVEAFCARASDLGVYGLIVPDMPLDEEEREGFLAACRKYRLHPIQVVSPLTSEERLAEIADAASGFVYCVARKGITGVQGEMSEGLEEYLARVRRKIDLPLALGFGISTPEEIQEVCTLADFAVIGSYIMNLYLKGGITEVESFLKTC